MKTKHTMANFSFLNHIKFKALLSNSIYNFLDMDSSIKDKSCNFMVWNRRATLYSTKHAYLWMRPEETLGSNLFLEYLNSASKIKYIKAAGFSEF